MTLQILHERIATSVELFMAIAALWGLVTYLRGRGMGSSYWGILAVGELLLVAQGTLGILIWLSGARPARGVHLLYGAVAVVTLPAYYAMSKGREDRGATLAYSLICLFLLGIGLRAIGTGA
jgi:hypothetical protein